MHASSAPSNNGDVQLLQNSGDFKVQNPVHSEQVTANAQALPFQEDLIEKPPIGRFRSHLCSCCCNCPLCLLAIFFPWVIWAQAHKALHGGTVDKEKGVRGYYVIMAIFIVLTFVLSLAGANGSTPFFTSVQFLFDAVGFFILVSLVRRARKMYSIPGNQCESCCQCCSDGCCDALKVVFCHCCTTFQLGDHLFDYTNNTEITYEATPVVEIV